MGVKSVFVGSAMIVATWSGGLVAVVHFTDAEVEARQEQVSEEGRHGCTEGKTRTEAGCRPFRIPDPPAGSYVGWDLSPR